MHGPTFDTAFKAWNDASQPKMHDSTNYSNGDTSNNIKKMFRDSIFVIAGGGGTSGGGRAHTGDANYFHQNIHGQTSEEGAAGSAGSSFKTVRFPLPGSIFKFPAKAWVILE